MFLFALEDDTEALVHLVVECLIIRPLKLQVAARRASRNMYYADDLVFRTVKTAIAEEPPPLFDRQSNRLTPAPTTLHVNVRELVLLAFQRFVRPIVEPGPTIQGLLERTRPRLELSASAFCGLRLTAPYEEIRDIYMDSASPFGRKDRLNTKRLSQADSKEAFGN
jgi:hypothetical protein